MPAEAIHLTALREALTSERADSAARKSVARREEAARLGAILVDLPYFESFPTEVVRYVFKLTPGNQPWGARLHEEGPVDLLLALIDSARQARDPLVAATVIGLASHCFIDRALHPLINALASQRALREGGSQSAGHREVEKFQSICFHERYHGRDEMGTARLERYIGVSLAAELDTHPLGATLVRGFTAAFASAPAAAELGNWGRGYASYTALLGSWLGARIALPADKDRARPLYLSGAWGRFEALLDEAIAGSVDVINAATTAIECDDRDLGAARNALLTLLPRGTIDGMGADVNLDEPYLGCRRLA